MFSDLNPTSQGDHLTLFQPISQLPFSAKPETKISCEKSIFRTNERSFLQAQHSYSFNETDLELYPARPPAYESNFYSDISVQLQFFQNQISPTSIFYIFIFFQLQISSPSNFFNFKFLQLQLFSTTNIFNLIFLQLQISSTSNFFYFNFLRHKISSTSNFFNLDFDQLQISSTKNFFTFKLLQSQISSTSNFFNFKFLRF